MMSIIGGNINIYNDIASGFVNVIHVLCDGESLIHSTSIPSVRVHQPTRNVPHSYIYSISCIPQFRI